jgi:hypothetical protein
MRITKNKIAIQAKAKDLDKILNQTTIEYYWIVRNNVYLTSYYDNDKFNVVLQILPKSIDKKGMI